MAAKTSLTIQETIHRFMIKQKLTLSAAESCTGGALTATLIELPGASAYFKGSVVAYADDVKVNALKVPKKLIQTHGAVSAAVAGEMLKGIFKLTKSDYAIAITGIAGPDGGTPQKPVGTVWLAVGKKGKKSIVWNIHLRGNRKQVIARSVNEALKGLWLLLSL